MGWENPRAPMLNFSETERRRSFQLNMLIGIAGAVFLTAFGSLALFDRQYPLAANLLAIALWGVFFLYLMQRTGNPHYGAYGVSLAAAYVSLYLIVTGGADATGPLWCYPLIVIIMFLLGFRRGAAVATGLIVLFLILLFMPNLPFTVADYSTTFKIRFVASFLALTIMSMIYEYLRGKSQQNSQMISARLDAASRTDDLTQLANRREMRHLMASEYERYVRHGNAFSILMVDLDHFKKVNDRYGHNIGDELLIEISRHFEAALRTEDRAARWGGEEFLILLPQTSGEQATRVAEKLRKVVAGIDMSSRGMNEGATASFGVQCVDQATGIEDLVNQADRKLYQAKNLGRNRVVSSIEADMTAVAAAASGASVNAAN